MTEKESRELRPAPRVLMRKDGTTALSWGPARGYSRRPFRKGNMAGVRHGAYSERIIEEVAVEVAEELVTVLSRSRLAE
ncbi:MAG TPA: hypothetical protein VEJ84_21490 [Acidimicrobiales bacterium]|nr:hypothetical protein [Acidimicrobiales bacterium]